MKPTAQLNDFRNAWPLINQLALQPQEIMKHMRQASRTALASFKRLVASDPNWSLLTELFLVQDPGEMPVIDSQKLINFLRQPHWVMQFKQLINSLKVEARTILSRHWLTQGDTPADGLLRLQQMQAFYTEYPFTLDEHVLKTIIDQYIPSFQQKELLPLSREFIVLLDMLFQSMSVAQQLDLLKTLTVFDRIDLIEHCIKVQPLVDAGASDAYHRVLVLLCAHTALLKEDDRELIRLQLIKIGQLITYPSVYNLKNPFEVAHSLEQMMRSPSFIATATPEVIKSMSLRYRCLALTYTHEELMSFLEPAVKINPYYQKLMGHFAEIQHALDDNPQQKALIEKKCRLIDWFLERMVHVLINELIAEGMDKQCQYRQALERFFDYYCRPETSLRSDLLIHAANHFYSSVEAPSKVFVESKFEQWRHTFKGRWENKLPQHDNYLYSESGQCVALVDELNRVWSLVTDEPTLVGQAQKQQDYYNQDKMHIGTLTDSGYFRPLGIAHYGVSAHILGVVPIEELEQSPRGLSLLIHHLLLENSLHLLYDYKEFRQGPIKRMWFEEQCCRVIKEMTYPLAVSTSNNLIAHFNKDKLFSLLPDSTYTANALSLFHSFFTNKAFVESWLQGGYTQSFHRFLERQGAVCLADYLLRYHRMSWFFEGLGLFAAYPQRPQHGFLPQALNILSRKVANNKLSEKTFNTVLRRLSCSEEAVRLLLEDFGHDDGKQPVQEVRNKGLNKILECFDKAHLMHLIRRLITLSSWQHCQQYRFALFMLQIHQDSLFQPHPEGSTPWRVEEVSDFAVFIDRHLEEKSLWDNKSSIGFKVLGAFTFHHAEQGQTILFCKGPRKISRVATFLVSPLILGQLVDKFILPHFNQEGVPQVERDTLKQRREYRERLVLQLPENTVVQAWHKLITNNENQFNKYMPLLAIYLFHYSGPSSAVQHLLEYYFLSVKVEKKNQLIHPISELLIHFSERDISAVIFDSLLTALTRKPLLLDLTVLRHLTHYWSIKKGLSSVTPLDLEIKLITQWGNRKYYALVHQACQLLLTECKDAPLRQRLERALVEAQVEDRIHHLEQRPFIYVLPVKWLNRLWHYGFNWESKSELLVLADAEESAPASVQEVFSSSQINTGLQVKKAPVMKERDDAIHLLTQVIRSSFSVAGIGLAQSRSSLFDFKSTPASQAEHGLNDAASKQSMAKV